MKTNTKTTNYLLRYIDEYNDDLMDQIREIETLDSDWSIYDIELAREKLSGLINAISTYHHGWGEIIKMCMEIKKELEETNYDAYYIFSWFFKDLKEYYETVLA